ncbi:MAG: Processing protease [Candidatus Nomurabacteria bacterium GW2011_GWF2_43_8]|uniref:Processing protease n=2 Tax=Candidatus Nomuraibacteriota TaxID=1752729 RepID=A0A0G1FR10_9BACT|nr:MAG: Processing protease [Candidatus Nomurabacteria bacterium GW2011_GWA2_43_15]KKT24518.1 MAG: Processing protease [Candidatus Nomurabacteria bacterium GW2011_GWF2_43_8]
MKFSKKVLKNGLRVVTIPMKDNPTATVLVLVEAGSKYETKKVNGISHFLEHMCFKGTIKRPKAIDISKELDALGSQYNAFTAQEYTGYYAKSDAKHFNKIFDIVSDIYLNSTFPEAEMEKEKGVIIEEINMYEDLPNRHVQDLIMKLLYGDTPAGWNIVGEKKNILGMKRDDFIRYKKEHYLPEATVIIVAGAVTEREVVKKANKIFGRVKPGKKIGKAKVKEAQKKPAALVNFKKTDQTHFVLGVRSYGLFSRKNAVLSVLGGVLGGGMSSRLFQKLREEMGVGYYVRAYNDAYTDHGFLQISAGVDNKRIEEVIKAVIEECRKLKRELVFKEELEKVKECLIGNMKLSLESSDDIANFYGGQELLKRELKNAEEKAKEIRKVTAGQIKKIANEIFQNKGLNLALVGPFRRKQEKNRLLKLLQF